MRKFVIVSLILLVLALGAYYGIFEGGFYLPVSGETEVLFRASGRSLQRDTGAGWEDLTLRGVELTGSLPGHHTTDYAPTREDYTRWMEEILRMGANTVYAPVIMDDDFYNALWEVNRQEPLYLIQGITVSDELNNRTETIRESGLMDALIQNGKTAVDVIHGRRNIASGGVGGSGRYRKDVSGVVLGYLAGSGWQEDTIAYTDHSEPRGEVYEGLYFSASPDASPTESLAAQILDEITRYETEKYLTQRPVGIMTDPVTDFLRYGEVYARQLGKYAFLDPNHIRCGAAMAAGQMTGYTLSSFCSELNRCLSEEQKASLAPLLAGMDETEIFGGLLSLLPAYYEMPAVGFYGFSSARGTVDGERLTEREQGERLADLSARLERHHWAGGIITSWQDGWTRRSWNTAYATDTAESLYWYDVQTPAKNAGLLAFEPGEKAVCVIDGDRSEWTEKDLVCSGDHPLSVRQDAAGLYLLIENVTRDTNVYVPMDVSPETGSAVCEKPALTFGRDADFLLIVSGETETRLLVQERYDPVRAGFLYEIDGEDPYITPPGKNSSRFVPILLPVENRTLLDMPAAGSEVKLNTVETGKLTHGCGNPLDESWLSLTDFCFGAGFVEVRLPWLLLNFGDPAHLRVHRDAYEHYGIVLRGIRDIYLGAGSEGLLSMSRYRLKSWGSSAPFRERLKESYWVLRERWSDSAAN